MRMKSLFGLLAIGGAVAYAQKKRGGELSLAGFKKTFNELVGSARDKVASSSEDDMSSFGSSNRTRSSYGTESSGLNRTDR